MTMDDIAVPAEELTLEQKHARLEARVLKIEKKLNWIRKFLSGLTIGRSKIKKVLAAMDAIDAGED